MLLCGSFVKEQTLASLISVYNLLVGAGGLVYSILFFDSDYLLILSDSNSNNLLTAIAGLKLATGILGLGHRITIPTKPCTLDLWLYIPLVCGELVSSLYYFHMYDVYE